jgi:LuxR family maltose regulon positive regulatory protein
MAAVATPLPGDIPRPDLADRLAAAVRAGHVLLAAPAGSGKTIAVREALRDWAGPVAWHACREADRDGGRLVLGLVRAIRAAVPGLADVLAGELERAGMTVDPLRALTGLRDDVERLLVEPLVVVLDDLERIVGHDDAEAVVTALLEGGPRLHVVLSTRRRPRRGIAKLTAAGRLTAFAAADLVLTPGECARVLSARLGREPTEPEVEAVVRATGGWALGVALGGRSGQELSAFVAEEVLGPLPADERARVLDSAVVDDLTPGVLAALGLDPATLERLTVHGLRPDVGTGRAGWHPLLREALRARWRTERPEADRRALLARVAGGLRADGRETEAVDAWLAAGREDAALETLVPVLPRVVRLAPDTVAGWLGALSQAARATPPARLAEAELAVSEGRHADALVPLREAEAGLRAQGATEAADAALALRLEALYWLGRYAEIEDEAAPVLGPPATLGGRPHALLAVIWAAAGRGSRGDIAGLEVLAGVVGAHPDGALARTRLPLLEFYRALPGGDHDRAIARLLAGLDALREQDHAEAKPETFHSFVAFLLVDSGRAEEARGLSARVVAEVERTG